VSWGEIRQEEKELPCVGLVGCFEVEVEQKRGKSKRWRRSWRG
jgi:hypothetical protein